MPSNAYIFELLKGHTRNPENLLATRLDIYESRVQEEKKIDRLFRGNQRKRRRPKGAGATADVPAADGTSSGSADSTAHRISAATAPSSSANAANDEDIEVFEADVSIVRARMTQGGERDPRNTGPSGNEIAASSTSYTQEETREAIARLQERITAVLRGDTIAGPHDDEEEEGGDEDEDEEEEENLMVVDVLQNLWSLFEDSVESAILLQHLDIGSIQGAAESNMFLLDEGNSDVSDDDMVVGGFETRAEAVAACRTDLPPVPYLVATKLSGDEAVPAGTVTWISLNLPSIGEPSVEAFVQVRYMQSAEEEEEGEETEYPTPFEGMYGFGWASIELSLLSCDRLFGVAFDGDFSGSFVRISDTNHVSDEGAWPNNLDVSPSEPSASLSPSSYASSSPETETTSAEILCCPAVVPGRNGSGPSMSFTRVGHLRGEEANGENAIATALRAIAGYSRIFQKVGAFARWTKPDVATSSFPWDTFSDVSTRSILDRNATIVRTVKLVRRKRGSRREASNERRSHDTRGSQRRTMSKETTNFLVVESPRQLRNVHIGRETKEALFRDAVTAALPSSTSCHVLVRRMFGIDSKGAQIDIGWHVQLHTVRGTLEGEDYYEDTATFLSFALLELDNHEKLLVFAESENLSTIEDPESNPELAESSELDRYLLRSEISHTWAAPLSSSHEVDLFRWHRRSDGLVTVPTALDVLEKVRRSETIEMERQRSRRESAGGALAPSRRGGEETGTRNVVMSLTADGGLKFS
eukprot:g5038.t1